MADNDLIVTNEEFQAIGVKGIPGRGYKGVSFEAYGYRFIGSSPSQQPATQSAFGLAKSLLPRRPKLPALRLQSTGRSAVGFVADEPTAAMFNIQPACVAALELIL